MRVRDVDLEQAIDERIFEGMLGKTVSGGFVERALKDLLDLRNAAREIVDVGEYATDEYGVQVVEKEKLDKLRSLVMEAGR